MKKLSLLICALLTWGAAAGDYSRELNEIKEGKRTEAMASWWGFNPENATECLQNAINSGVKTLTVDNTGKDWVLDRIKLASDQEIVLAKGVRLVARKGGFKTVRGSSSFISFGSGRNIILRGEADAVIMMHKKDYQNKKLYEHSEWRHILDIRGGENITIRDLRLEAGGGDGIYLGNGSPPSKPARHCTNITIENVVCHDNHRQGISVITAENLLIKNCVFSNTSGTPPQAGIDFEPNAPDERLVNCRIEDTTFSGNKGPGTDNYLVNLKNSSEPVSITYSRCKILNNGRGAKISLAKAGATDSVKGFIEYIDCEIAGAWPVEAADTWDGFKVIMKNCRITQRNQEALIITAAYSPYPVGNIILDNVAVVSKGAAESPLYLKYTPSRVFGSGVTGTLKFNGKNFDFSKYQAAETARSRELAELKPAADLTGLKAAPADGRKYDKSDIHWFRRGACMLFLAESGEKIQIRMYPHSPPQEKGKITAFLYRPGAEKAEQTVVPANQEGYFLYEFTAETAGEYRVTASSGNERYHLRFESDHPGQGMLMRQNFQLFKPQDKLYFQVPAGVKEFKIMVWCNPNHHADVKLLDPDGKTVQEEKNFNRPAILTGQRDDTGSAIWALDFANASEVVYVMLVEPLSPIVSSAPGLMLRKP